MARVSVVVATTDPGPDLLGLVRAIDAQSVPAAVFDVVVADASGDGSTERLRQLAGRRPNVTVIDAGGADGMRAALAAVQTEFVLPIGQQDRLAPRALELLLAAADRSGADVVLGRASGATSGSALLADDTDRIETADLNAAGLDAAARACIALVRRSFLPDAAEWPTDLWSLVAGAGHVAAVGRYACARRVAVAQPAAARPDAGVEIAATTGMWHDDGLQLTAGISAPASAAWLVLSRGPVEIAIQASVAIADAGAGAGSTVTATVAPQTADGGHPLERGLWDLRIRLVADGRESTTPIGSGSAQPAIIDGRPYAVHSAGSTLRLDAGATTGGLTGRVTAGDTALHESAAGMLATLRLPAVHVHGDAVLDARLVLGGFSLPARVIAEAGRARLEAMASALAGTSRVELAVGGAATAATGLLLVTDGTGGMRFTVPAPPPAPAPPPPPARIQLLRRRLPAALEPVAKRLARVPVLRRTYRSLMGR